LKPTVRAAGGLLLWRPRSQAPVAAIPAGHNHTLTLTSHDENNPGDPTYILYDDVKTS
jgi:hypothetical protein